MRASVTCWTCIARVRRRPRLVCRYCCGYTVARGRSGTRASKACRCCIAWRAAAGSPSPSTIGSGLLIDFRIRWWTSSGRSPGYAEYQPGFEAVDTTLAGVIPLYGRFDFIDRGGALPDKRGLISFLGSNVMPCRYEDDPAMWDQASPIAQLGSHAPPMFVLHGTHDSVIPLAEAEAFVAALRRLSTEPVAFARLHGAQHAWDLFNTPWTDHTVNAVHSFCEYLYARYIERSSSI
jgi:hypothetical protein